MKIEEILRAKGHQVVTIAESQSVLDATRVLTGHGIGALLVTERQRPTGILTERDILRLTARDPGPARLDPRRQRNDARNDNNTSRKTSLPR